MTSDNTERSERIAGALAGIQAKIAAKDAEILSLRSLRDRLQAKLAITPWAELDSGASIKVGDTVRYLLRYWTCTKAHTKALLRAPTNAEYWQEAEI